LILPSMKPEIPGTRVIRYAEAPLPTRRGDVRLVVYREQVDGRTNQDKEHVAVIIGQPERKAASVLVRAHSECLTSEVFGSMKCDCREQLDSALDRMIEEKEGVLLYLRQEGRGIGLGNKIRAYKLQSEGADTIEANHQLGFETDYRTYDIAAGMLHDLGIERVRLLTNNPDKVQGMVSFGIEVERRESIEIAPNEHSEGYLQTKKQMGHFLGRLLDAE